MSTLNPLNTIRCEKCDGQGYLENEGVTSACPVCDGDPIITYATVAEYARQIDKLWHDVGEAQSHLGAALLQSIPTDDPIIVGHIKSAYEALGGRA